MVQFGEAGQIGVAGLTSDQRFPGCLVAGSPGGKARVRGEVKVTWGEGLAAR